MNAGALMPSVDEDFPDWVNPFVVKELRQGLRSRIFVSVFVALHSCVALVIILGFVMSPEPTGQFQMGHAMQWVAEASCVCLLLPMGGYVSVSEELKADSLELIRVAGVTSGQIVMGKWQAQLAQATLLLISVTPYHLLQYYLDHAGPLGQMAGLYSCWLLSLLMTAMMMFYATLKLMGKMGCALFGLPVMLMVAAFMLRAVFSVMFRLTGEGVVEVIVETVIWAAGLLFFLSLAVSGLDMRVRANPTFEVIPVAEWGKEIPLP